MVAKRRGVGSPNGSVLILPPFGVAASALELVADLVVAEGFEAVLLDPRDSTGAGSGDIGEFRLSTLVEDCRAAVEHYRPDVVLAVSLSARAAARALAEIAEPPRSVFLLPVVDVRSTLTTVLDRDWFTVPDDEVPTRVRVLGFDILAEPFIADCLELGILSPESMRRDLEALDTSVTLLPGTRDPWIDHATVTEIFDAVGSSDPRIKMRSLACDQHELHRHPALAVRLITECVAEACAPAMELQI